MANQTFMYDVAKQLTANNYTKTGYVFAGWATSSNGEVVYANRQEVLNLVDTPNGTITLYAKWSPNNYTVIYNKNAPPETVSGTMESSVFVYDRKEPLKANEYVRTGYTFEKWNTKQDGTGTDYANSEEVQNLTSTPNGSVTLYAKWKANKYTINYNKNVTDPSSVTGTMQPTNCTYDQITALRKNDFTRIGYTFIGWRIVPNLENIENPAEEYKIYNDEEPVQNLVEQNNGEITLYAQWEANNNTAYTVTHYVKNTQGNYETLLTENLTGTTDSEIILANMVKTTPQYNVPNGIYFKKITIDGSTAVEADITPENEKTSETIRQLDGEKTTIKPDGSLQIGIYYERAYGKLTITKGANIQRANATEEGNEISINNRTFYYGESVPKLTATMNFETGYIISFTEWTSSNQTYLPSITSNPSEAFSWPAMPSNTSITLTARATKVESNDTQYKVNYYLEKANESGYELNRSIYKYGTTGAQITESMIRIEWENCTFHHTDLAPTTIIKADGTAEVNIYYTRNTYTLEVAGGENITSVKVSTQRVETVDNDVPLSINKTLKWGESADIEVVVENIEGYTYVYTGWTTTSTANMGANYSAGSRSTKITMPPENIKLTATASKTANMYKIKFNPNTGSGTMADQQFTYDIAQNLTTNTFTKTGYTFKGWATANTLEQLNNNEITIEEAVVYTEEQQVSNLTTENNKTINLYAIWKDETAPVLSIETESTTHSIDVVVTAIETGSGLAGDYKYYIGTMQEVDDGLGGTVSQIVYEEPIPKEGSTHTFDDLEDNKTYYIKVEKADNAGNLGIITDQLVETTLLSGEVTFSDAYWSNGKYILTVNTEATNELGNTYEIQYQVLTAEEIQTLKGEGVTDEQIASGAGVTEEKWQEETILTGEILGNGQIDAQGSGTYGIGNQENEEQRSGTYSLNNNQSLENLILKDGDIVYARVYDGTNGAEVYYSYSITNPAPKTYTEEELANVTYGTTTFDILAYETSSNSFNVNIEREIAGTEIYTYYAKASNESDYKLISTSTNWDDSADISNELLAKTTLNREIQLKENETYKVKVLARQANGTTTQCLNTATIITQAKAEPGTIYSQNRTYIDSENHTAVVPSGFKVSTVDTEKTISKGIVLKDENNNEFVWVPVNHAKHIEGATAIPTGTGSKTMYYKPMAVKQEGTEFYQSKPYYYTGLVSYRWNDNYKIGNSNYREPSLITGVADGYTWNVSSPVGNSYDANSQNHLEKLGFTNTQEYGNYINKEYSNMVNSTDTYGGFYISRYETSLNGNKVESKANKTPMSNLDWYDLYFNEDSNRNANSTYYSSNSVTSNMVWGSQYDAMLNWMLTGTDKSKLTVTNIGNKSNEQKTTGSYSNDIINNVYDLVANTYEWTQEAYSTNSRSYRGGSYSNSDIANATRRATILNPNNLGPGYGTRLALYVNGTETAKVPGLEIISTSKTASTISVKVNAKAYGSGIAKYCYSISEDGENWENFETYSPEYTYMGLTANTNYIIKVQARDNRGNMSIAQTENITTNVVTLEEGVIYVKDKLGASGNGTVILGVREDYVSQGYNVEYQVVLGPDAIAAGKETDESNGVYNEVTINGNWLSGNSVTGLYENDVIYARLNDNTNITPYAVINVVGLERFSAIYSATTEITDEDGNKATIPAGFAVGTSEGINKVNSGLVIQDALGNQFVWVPVEQALYTGTGTPYPTGTSSTSTYKPMAIYQQNSTNYYQSLIYSFNQSTPSLSYANTGWKLGTSNYREPSVLTGSGYDGYTWDLDSLTETVGTGYDAYSGYYKNLLKFSSVNEYGKYKNEEYKNMIDSVEQYKGFYVGRYETSIDSVASKKAQSQGGKSVLDNTNGDKGGYNVIYYQDSNRNPNNPYYNNSSVTSSMIWNAQWDSMLNWILRTDNSNEQIEESGKNHNIEKVFSTTLGNRKDGTLPDLSGYNGDDKTNNIYDLGGNVQEITQGSQGSNNNSARGGAYHRSNDYPGTYNMTYMRTWCIVNTSTAYSNFGTRMSLYITKQNDTTKPTISLNGEVTSTTNSIYIKVNASDENSGIKKYHYYISTDGTNYTEYIGWGNSYTFEGLTQGTTYYVKATVEDKAGNISTETPVQTKQTIAVDAIDSILTPRVYGSQGNGHAYFSITPEYEAQGYYVEYQVGKNGVECNENGTWYKDDSRTATGLNVGDKVYARINDSTDNNRRNGNITSYRTLNITELETFDNTLEAAATNKVEGVYYVYTDSEGNSARIPSGFSVGATSSINKISNGLVVQDQNGNQYVWVPVDTNSVVYDGTTEIVTNGTSTYKPMVQYQNGYGPSTTEQYFEMIRYDYNKNYETGSKIAAVSSKKPSYQLGVNTFREPSLVTGAANYSWVFQASNNQYDAVSTYYNGICGFSSTKEMGEYMNEQYTEMIQSIKENGGFYIGRFETSLSSGVVQSKLNITPMGAGTGEGNLWYGEYYKQDSLRNATNPYYGSTSVVSSMIWGSQYDAMLNWVLTGSDASMVHKITGNHSNSRKKTGAYGSDIMNNIFDLSANQFEWTQEAYSTNSRVRRGGYYNATNTSVASSRYNSYPTSSNGINGSRLTLYIRSPEP